MRAFGIGLLAVLMLGCGGQVPTEQSPTPAAPAPKPQVAEVAMPGAGDAAIAAPVIARDDRKVIYTGKVAIRVEKLAAAVTQFEALVTKREGYIASSNLQTRAGTLSVATWRVRVPSDRYREFLRAVSELGQLMEQSSSSQEVTEEFIDLEARIKNLQRQETRLEARLDRPKGGDDQLRVEQEIARVRTDIERMQGRLRLLTDQTTMSTVDITFTEARAFDAPIKVTELVSPNASAQHLLSHSRS